jgi:hypothetical protein
MVEVFKTNVQEIGHAKKLVNLLLQQFPGSRINFDLHDCDKILRVESENINTETVMMLVEQNGFQCNMLD